MKHFLIAALLTSPVYAEDTAAELCPMLGELAVKTLELRQSGVPLSKLMEVAEDNALLVAISIDAYKLPMFSSPVFIQEQKNEFRNAIELACYTAEAP